MKTVLHDLYAVGIGIPFKDETYVTYQDSVRTAQ
jgi:hypothetical protein